MKTNIISYFKSYRLWIITFIYLFGFTSLKLAYYSIYFNEINTETYLFSNCLSLFLIPNMEMKKMVLSLIPMLEIPTFLYILFIGLTYYHHSFEMDSTFIFLRIARKKKFIKYYIEGFIVLVSFYSISILYQLMFIKLKHNININWNIIFNNFSTTILYFNLFIIILVILQFLLDDLKSASISFMLIAIFSYLNYYLNFPNLVKLPSDYTSIPIINNKVLNANFPTLMNIIYYNNFIYTITLISLNFILIFFSLIIIRNIDINKGVIK